MVLVGLAYYMLVQVQRPSEPVIRQLQSQFRVYGFAVFCLVPLLAAIRRHSLMAMFNQSVRGFALYSAVLFMLGQVGVSDFVRLLANEPERAAIGLVLVGLCFLVVSMSGVLGQHEAMSHPQGTSQQALADASEIQRPATRRDVRYVAAHESGHVMLYAAFPVPPKDLRIVVHLQSSTKGVMGFVSGLNVEHQLTEKTFSEWYMLMCLAGQYGEKHIHSEVTLGNVDDYQRWMHVAALYLSSGSGNGVFYPEPKSALEIQYNERRLIQLRKHQERCLESFFELNSDLINEMYFRVMEQKKLDVHDIRDLLFKVEFPPAFPRPGSQDGS